MQKIAKNEKIICFILNIHHENILLNVLFGKIKVARLGIFQLSERDGKLFEGFSRSRIVESSKSIQNLDEFIYLIIRDMKFRRIKDEKIIGKIIKEIAMFQSEMFDIVVEYKELNLPFNDKNEKKKWGINFEMRQKNSSFSPYKGEIKELFEGLDEARDFFINFLNKNFILKPIEKNEY